MQMYGDSTQALGTVMGRVFYLLAHLHPACDLVVKPIITISDHCSLNTVEEQHLLLLWISKYFVIHNNSKRFLRDVKIDVYLNNVHSVMEMNQVAIQESSYAGLRWAEKLHNGLKNYTNVLVVAATGQIL